MERNIYRQIGTFNTPGTLKFWCQKVLPLVYDDSLSYYELLCKVVDYINKLLEDDATLTANITQLGESFDELHEFVDDYFDNLDVSQEISDKIDAMIADDTFLHLLEQIYPGFVTPEMFGAVGDGETDDSAAFTDAITYAVQNNMFMLLSNKTYNAPNITTLDICSIYGDNARWLIGEHYFSYEGILTIKGVTIESTYASTTAGTYGSFLTPATNTPAVHIENVTFLNTNADDEHRGRIFLRAITDKLFVNGLTVVGSRAGIIVGNNSSVTPDSYNISNVVGKNVQTLIDFEGYLDSTTYSGSLYNVSINNITLVNTLAEQASATTVVGSDCLLLTNIENLSVANVISNNARERAVYAVNVKRAKISGITATGSEGVKVVGYQMQNSTLYSEDIYISNVSVTTGAYCVMFYECKNVHCYDLSFNTPISSTFTPDHCIAITGECYDITIDGVTGSNSGRRFLYMYAAQDRRNHIENVKIANVLYDYPGNKVNTYYALLITGSVTFAYNITFENVKFNPGKYKYNASSLCAGLIDASYVSGLNLDNCDCLDICTLGTGYKIDDTCTSVYVTAEIYATGTPPVPDFKSSIANIRLITKVNDKSYCGVTDCITSQNNNITAISGNYACNYQFTYVATRATNFVVLPPNISYGCFELITAYGYYKGCIQNGTLTEIAEEGTDFTNVFTLTWDATYGLLAMPNVGGRVVQGNASFSF